MAKALKAPARLSEADVNRGISEYKKLSKPASIPKATPVKPPKVPKYTPSPTEPKIPWTPERQHGAVMSKIYRDELRKVEAEKLPKPPPKAPKIALAKPVGKIEPRVESRVRALAKSKVIGEIKPTTLPSPSLKGLRDRGPIPTSRAPAVVGASSKAVEKRVVGGLAKTGAITPKGSAFQTHAATGAAIKGSRSLFGKLGGKARGLGYLAAGFIPNEKVQTAVQAGMHAGTARAAFKAGATAVGKRALPWVGTAFAASEVAGAVGAARGALKAEKEAQHNREYQAVKYASPLVHQQFLRARAATQKGAMPDSTKTGVTHKTAASAASIKPGKSAFGTAFSQARKSGKKEFEYKGKKYHTRLAAEPVKVSKSISQNHETMKPQYDSQKFVNNIVRADVDEPATPAATQKKTKISFGAFLKAHPKFKVR